MLNMLPKGMIIKNIVDTLKKDPENGLIKLLGTARSYSKTPEKRIIIAEIIQYYKTSPIAKMQIRNLVHNTAEKTLYSFADKIFDTISSHSAKSKHSKNMQPFTIDFMSIITMAEAAGLKRGVPVQRFPVIDLKNLNDTSKEVLAKLKNDGQIFFVSIAITEENFDTVTSDEVIVMLVKHGVRAIFYRMSNEHMALEGQVLGKVHQIRTQRPILAFFMKKDAPDSTSPNYVITENVKGKDYMVRLNLR